MFTVSDPEPSLLVVSNEMVNCFPKFLDVELGLYFPVLRIRSLDPVSIKMLRSLEAPMVKLANQKPFSILVKCLLHMDTNDGHSLGRQPLEYCPFPQLPPDG